MKKTVAAVIGIALIASCQQDDVVSDAQTDNEDVESRVCSFNNAYWYSSELFEGNVIYIGSLTVIEKSPTHREDLKTSYRLSITDIIKRSDSVISDLRVGDVIQSTTLRNVVDGADHVVCLSRYPEGIDGDVVTDGGFPLCVDEKILRVIDVMRSYGFDPVKYEEGDYEFIRGYLRHPEMYDQLRKKQN